MSPEQDEFRRRAVRAALIVAGIAVAIGLVVGGLTATAVYVTDVLPDPASTPTVPEDETDDSLPSPSLSPTASPSPQQSPTPSQTAVAGGTPSPSASPASSSTPEASPTKESRRPKRKAEPDGAIRLRAGSSAAGTFERVTLSGRYPGGNGTTLQVQRREGGSWVAFPTSATVSGGTFSTYIASGQSGPNQFRVVDPATGQTSNVVVVNVS